VNSEHVLAVVSLL